MVLPFGEEVLYRIGPLRFHQEKDHLEQHLHPLLGSLFIANVVLTMNGPRGETSCSRGSKEVTTGNNTLPNPSTTRFFLELRETSEGTSYEMVPLVSRHFAAASIRGLPEFALLRHISRFSAC